MRIKFILPILLGVVLVSCSNTDTQLQTASPSEYVSTLVGTLSDYSLSTGNTYPATAVPWGMNFWTPVTAKMGDGWAYTYTSHKIRGFKQTHQPSPWINDYGQFELMPLRDASMWDEDSRASFFSHSAETAKPYLYSVYLADHDVKVEMSALDRGAVLRFTYPESKTSGFVLDAFAKDCSIALADNYTIVGYTTNNHGGVPENFRNYFIIKSDKSLSDCTIEGDKLVVRFSTERGEKVNLHVASSFISEAQAKVNLCEVDGKTLESVSSEAKAKWDEILGRIEIGGASEDQMRTFYSCLYRATLFPRKFYEIDSEGNKVHYSPYNGEVCQGTLYTDSGFWDVFRALFPLLNLVYPDVSAEIMEGFVNISKENDFLPEWASPGHRNCMVGNNSASIVADAVLSGIVPEGIEELYQTILYGTRNNHPRVKSSGRLGHQYYDSLGYIPYNVGINESVARTLEYSYDDWSILKLAKTLSRPQNEIDEFSSKALNYANVFDKESLLMRGRNEDGSFQSPFSPYKWGDAFTEGNAWHYTWSVFHDVQGLADLMGGEENFTRMLDSVFVVPPIYDDSYYGSRIHEITEMQVADMGNYAHGNQPAQHMIYLYDYVGQPWKSQKWSREVMNRLYSSHPDGYCGDEDNGQTSAWYVFSALGFYPVCPGSGEYALGSPLFKSAKIHLTNGKTVTLSAKNNSSDRPYVKTMSLNGKTYTHNYVTLGDLRKGARLDFVMDSDPNLYRGVEDKDKPYSFSRE